MAHFEVGLPLMSPNKDCFHGPSPDNWAGLMGPDKIGSNPYYSNKENFQINLKSFKLFS